MKTSTRLVLWGFIALATAGYDAACARCPQLLRPVTEFRTGIGRMLRAALSAGGMLPKHGICICSGTEGSSRRRKP